MCADREIMQKEVTHIAAAIFWTAFLYTDEFLRFGGESDSGAVDWAGFSEDAR
jgi:hypothetical protein